MTTNLSKDKIPVFILAGGLGTRLSEETQLKPKPMVEIGDIPILVHIMRYYYSFGFNDFVVCAGYRSWEIKQYFLNYEFRKSHLEIDHRVSTDQKPVGVGPNEAQERWRVRVIDTGVDTMTGGRIARALDAVTELEPFSHFALTYGDGVSDVNLDEELAFHFKHGKIGTVLGVHPTARFGELEVSSNKVNSFEEKPQSKQGLINGGFFFLKREFRKYLGNDDAMILEKSPLSTLAKDGELMMYQHPGFWQPMDTLRDRNMLQGLWESGKAPWLPRQQKNDKV
jgi:glucose-1-phosphate cytidylyltransferase